MNVAICDDDSQTRKELKDLITSYSINRNLPMHCFEFPTSQELLTSTGYFDILLLDILLEYREGKVVNGIDVGKQLRQAGRTPVIVLVTAESQYAMQGYEIRAFRYMMKPIITQDFYLLFDEIIKEYYPQKKRITVKETNGIHSIPLESILYITTDTITQSTRRRMIKTTNGIIYTWETLKELRSKLPPEQFIYAQKSYIVNLARVKILLNNREILMDDGETLALSRKSKKEFHNKHEAYMGPNK